MASYATQGPSGLNSTVLRLPPARGRVFVVGDIHGTFTLLAQALARLDFDPAVDLLICCGDLVDRGNQSHSAWAFLQEPWVFSVRGNHEQMILDGYEHGLDPLAAEHSQDNGGKWFLTLTPEEQNAHMAAYRALPLIIEIPTPLGLVGIVHAEVPHNMTWGQFTDAVARQDSDACYSAIWGRIRVKYGIRADVSGIWRIFCGHTVRPAVPQWLGNVCYLDTGANAAWRQGANASAALSVVNILAPKEAIAQPTRHPMLNLVSR